VNILNLTTYSNLTWPVVLNRPDQITFIHILILYTTPVLHQDMYTI